MFCANETGFLNLCATHYCQNFHFFSCWSENLQNWTLKKNLFLVPLDKGWGTLFSKVFVRTSVWYWYKEILIKIRLQPKLYYKERDKEKLLQVLLCRHSKLMQIFSKQCFFFCFSDPKFFRNKRVRNFVDLFNKLRRECTRDGSLLSFSVLYSIKVILTTLQTRTRHLNNFN